MADALARPAGRQPRPYGPLASDQAYELLEVVLYHSWQVGKEPCDLSVVVDAQPGSAGQRV